MGGGTLPGTGSCSRSLVIALFGYKKMPDAARSLGRSLRIFKTEIKGMSEDDKAREARATPPAHEPRRQRRRRSRRRRHRRRRHPVGRAAAEQTRPPPPTPADAHGRRRPPGHRSRTRAARCATGRAGVRAVLVPAVLVRPCAAPR